MKIAFVGPPAVGKDAVSDHIAEKFKLTHISSGDIVREYVLKNNLGSLERTNLRKVGNMLRAEKGGDVLVKISLEKNNDNLVLSGLRAIDEIETFKKLGGKVIAITAPLEKRYEFAKNRGRIDDKVTFEDFKRIEDEEFANKNRVNLNVGKVIEMADLEVVNNGTLEELFKKCEEVVQKL